MLIVLGYSLKIRRKNGEIMHILDAPGMKSYKFAEYCVQKGKKKTSSFNWSIMYLDSIAKCPDMPCSWATFGVVGTQPRVIWGSLTCWIAQLGLACGHVHEMSWLLNDVQLAVCSPVSRQVALCCVWESPEHEPECVSLSPWLLSATMSPCNTFPRECKPLKPFLPKRLLQNVLSQRQKAT